MSITNRPQSARQIDAWLDDKSYANYRENSRVFLERIDMFRIVITRHTSHAVVARVIGTIRDERVMHDVTMDLARVADWKMSTAGVYIPRKGMDPEPLVSKYMPRAVGSTTYAA